MRHIAWRPDAWRRALLRLAGRSDGAVALEFGLVVPMLIAVVIGVTDFSLGFARKMAVQAAAQAGAQYAVLNGWNSAAITAAITGATDLSGLTATAPAQFCGCASGNTLTTVGSGPPCTTTCPSGKTAGTYITVGAQYVYRTILSYPSLSNPVTMSAQATLRIK
jgi:Flp pilus assembly protein TadG